MSLEPILFVDDEADLRLAAEQTLGLADLSAQMFDRAEAALAHVSPEFPGILVTDIRMPGMDGAQLMAEALARDPDLPVILVTGHGDVDLAVQSMRDGAYDFIEKPYDPGRLVGTLRRALEKRRLTLELRRLRNSAEQDDTDPISTRLAGTSMAMQDFRARLRAVAGTNTDLLIEGATGTGKEVAARALHAASPRANRPFVAVNCAALPETLIDSELFGHTAGAFPGATRIRYGKFEHARGGTLFLDQIGSLPLPVQAKLLSVLEDRAITPLGSNDSVALDLRIVASNKGNLSDAVADGRFRDDLFYRLNSVTLRLPALSERREDIPLLFQTLLAQLAREHGRDIPVVGSQTIAAMAAGDWPGNVRELRNAAERMVLGLTEIAPADTPTLHDGLSDAMARHERGLIAAALSAHRGSIKATYEGLGISRKALYEKMQKHGLNRDDYR